MLLCLLQWNFGFPATEVGSGSGRAFVLFCLMNQRENCQVCPDFEHPPIMEKFTGEHMKVLKFQVPVESHMVAISQLIFVVCQRVRLGRFWTRQHCNGRITLASAVTYLPLQLRAPEEGLC